RKPGGTLSPRSRGWATVHVSLAPGARRQARPGRAIMQVRHNLQTVVTGSKRWDTGMSMSRRPLSAVPASTQAPPGTALESSVVLFERIRAGDARARETLVKRFHPVLLQWAHGLLPVGVRDLNETDDLVNKALLRALKHLEEFEPRRPGAFLAY